jgi:hypothetical protein
MSGGAATRQMRCRDPRDRAIELDGEQARRVRLPLLGKEAVSAHRFERRRAAGVDEKQ